MQATDLALGQAQNSSEHFDRVLAESRRPPERTGGAVTKANWQPIFSSSQTRPAVVGNKSGSIPVRAPANLVLVEGIGDLGQAACGAPAFHPCSDLATGVPTVSFLAQVEAGFVLHELYLGAPG